MGRTGYHRIYCGYAKNDELFFENDDNSVRETVMDAFSACIVSEFQI